MATGVNLAQANYPKEFHGETIQPMEGVSLVPAFSGNSLNRGQPIFWEHEGNRAIRHGDWKLVKKHPGKWELYDIATDRVEMHDLASQHVDRVESMSKQWQAWAERVGVQAWPLNIAEGKK